MILKFQNNLRIDKDSNIAISAESIVESEEQAEEAGVDFAKLQMAFLRGYGEGAKDVPGYGT